MREGATLKLDSGEEIRVDVDTDELGEDEIRVRRSQPGHTAPLADRLAALDEIIETGVPHPDGTTDRWLAADRDR